MYEVLEPFLVLNRNLISKNQLFEAEFGSEETLGEKHKIFGFFLHLKWTKSWWRLVFCSVSWSLRDHCSLKFWLHVSSITTDISMDKRAPIQGSFLKDWGGGWWRPLGAHNKYNRKRKQIVCMGFLLFLKIIKVPLLTFCVTNCVLRCLMLLTANSFCL